MAEPHPHRTAVGEPPPHVTMGLLDYVTATSLDEDYAHVHRLRERRGVPRTRTPGLSSIIAFVAFGLLVTMAGLQTARTAGVDATSHESLVSQVRSGRVVLDQSRERLAALQAELRRAQRDNTVANSNQRAQEQIVARYGAVVGTVPVTGPGVRMVVNDAEGAVTDQQLVLDSDLRDIVNGLWEAGAEAISINGNRLTTTSSIRVAGSVITVNYQNVLPPYTVLAIGDPARMPARFVESTTGSIWLNNKETFGLRSETRTEQSLRIPAADASRFRLRNATNPAEQVEGES